jgi:hypothetical protein
LWREGKLDAIGVGYGLSEDGLWREHYWGMKDDHIVETTASRVAYFGATFPGEGGNIIVGYLEA